MKTFYITLPDEQIRTAITEKINNLTKPKGSLGTLEELYINLKSDHTKIRSEITHAYSTFNTFGRLPSYENDWYVVFEFSTTYGTTQVDTINIGHLINDKELINNRWIIIDEIIDIQSPGTGEGSGGLTPEVGDWNIIDSEIRI